MADTLEVKLTFTETDTGTWELRGGDEGQVLVIFEDRDAAVSFGSAMLGEKETLEVTFRRLNR